MHRGRFLVATHRDTKEQAIIPMLARATAQDDNEHARLPPEGFLETYTPASEKSRAYHIHATDGSKGFEATFKSLQQLHVNSAVHSRDIFTPVEIVTSTALSSATKAVASKMTKNNTAKKVGHDYKIVGGDNKAEASVSVIKRQLRRVAKLQPLSGVKEHAAPMAVAWVHNNPGLDTGLIGLSQWRTAVCLRCSPNKVWKQIPWEW